MLKNTFKLLILLFFSIPLQAQISLDDKGNIDYATPKEYEIQKITFSGVQYTDTNICKLLTGLYEGQKITIPGEKTSTAITNLWNQGLFDKVRLFATRVEENKIWLEIELKEHPRLAAQPLFSSNVKKSEVDDLREKINLTKGDIITPNVIQRSQNAIKTYYHDKGYYNAEIKIKEIVDTASGKYSTKLNIDITRNKKVKVRKINITGNDHVSDFRLKRLLKKTKEKTVFNPFMGCDTLLFQSVKKLFVRDSISIEDNFLNYVNERINLRIFKSAKFLKDTYNKEKLAIIDKYNELGYRDSKIITDTIVRSGENTVDININIKEGRQYFFRKIIWIGNTIYSERELNAILKVKKGDIYNQKQLETNLSYNPEGYDVSSLYMDNGYLFFSATPVETAVENDSIDMEIRVIEGKQAYINKVSIRGNTKTKDHVVIREIRSKPGQLFNRSDIIRTTRELAQLKYFNAEKIIPDIIPNPADGTVDIEYSVEETSSDQLELSGGWGMGRLIGTLGVSFNNFSTKNFFKKSAWSPLPSGDGQKLSIRAQTNGKYYQAYNASFTEPWLGGHKPLALSVSVYYSSQTNGLAKSDSNRQAIGIAGASLGLGSRLKWPDDYFTLYHEISYRNYKLKNYYSTFDFTDGTSNNLNYTVTLSRNSIDAPIYPRSGSEVSLMAQLTPPFSLLNGKDYSKMPEKDKYQWIEYHKWKLSASVYTKLAGNLVLSVRTKFGFLGSYNKKELGIPPFERFYLGGDGLSGFSLDGRELIALRGYTNNSLTPRNSNGYVGGAIFDKFTIELRYPISLNPMATVYVLGFAEGGNAWDKWKDFKPFDVYRSAGIGVRVFLPMFGILGLDWGYGFDNIPGVGKGGSQFHFSINQSID
ncbi:MAG TPA: outer membrane protein assembly factor BamA [Bacteroidales bacterium]|nr:outer membrane protein assembly factor BamA [Bacteroidales bacterium]HPS26448.1 outer membrane protein assembly factor BamA [Bacteroidales bacterium]